MTIKTEKNPEDESSKLAEKRLAEQKKAREEQSQKDKAKNKAQKAEKSEVEVVVEESKMVTLESADDQTLEAYIGGDRYFGKSIRVSVEKEAHVRAVLTGGGYKLK